jgi:dephospho-CoA kinase
MGRLIAVTGFSGAGKTTAVQLLEDAGIGRRIYAGQIVLDEIAARGLPQGRDSENVIQLELRQEHGPLALAVLVTPQIMQHLESGSSVLLDAILSAAELGHYREVCKNRFTLLAILASFEVRAKRLEIRENKKSTAEQLQARDRNESQSLGIKDVIGAADHQLMNEGSLRDFEKQLRKISLS